MVTRYENVEFIPDNKGNYDCKLIMAGTKIGAVLQDNDGDRPYFIAYGSWCITPSNMSAILNFMISIWQ